MSIVHKARVKLESIHRCSAENHYCVGIPSERCCVCGRRLWWRCDPWVCDSMWSDSTSESFFCTRFLPRSSPSAHKVWYIRCGYIYLSYIAPKIWALLDLTTQSPGQQTLLAACLPGDYLSRPNLAWAAMRLSLAVLYSSITIIFSGCIWFLSYF